MIKKILFTALLFSYTLAFAQVEEDPKKQIRDASDLKTGNSQDILPSFYQLALKDLLGKSHNFQFQSSLFAIQAKSDSSIWIDTSYLKKIFARNFAFGINTSVDSNFKFKNNTLNLKYAIINQRDNTVFDYSKYMGKYSEASVKVLGEAIAIYKAENKVLTPEEYDYFDTDKAVAYEKLPADFRLILEKLYKKNDALKDIHPREYKKIMANKYKLTSNMVASRPLWTVDAKFVSNSSNMFSSVNVNTEFLKGMIKKNTAMNIELNAKLSYNFDNDSSFIQRNLNRQVFSGELGFNWIILKSASKDHSLVEFKAAAAMNYIASGIIKNEEPYSITANGTLRFRLTEDFWIPIDIKYDPQNGNVYGFLNVTSNFDWLNKFFNKRK